MRKIKNSFFALVWLLLVVLFQNCDRPLSFSSSDESTVMNSGGNGDSYTGKIEIYASYDQAAPCVKRDLNDRPFPNKQISASQGKAMLIRENCGDIEPRELTTAKLQFGASSDALEYDGERFDLISDFAPFNIVPLACPGSRSVATFDRNQNVFLSPLNWLSADWIAFTGVKATLDGAIGALPRYRIQRHDPLNLQNYNRLAQRRAIERNTEYAFTALVQGGNRNAATVYFYNQASEQFDVEFDLLRGTIDARPLGVRNVSGKIQPYESGYAVTVFFTSPSNPNYPDIGVSVGDGNNDSTALGDYVYATAADYRAVNSFCAP